MSKFPLYDNLIPNITHKDLTIREKEYVIKNIRDIDEQGKEIIYALIQTYWESKTPSDSLTTTIPYKGIINPNKEFWDLTWNLNNFPSDLKQILFRFVKIHAKTVQEDIRRNTPSI